MGMGQRLQRLKGFPAQATGFTAPPDYPSDIKNALQEAFDVLEELPDISRAAIEKAVLMAVHVAWNYRTKELAQKNQALCELQGRLKVSERQAEDRADGQLEFWQKVAHSSASSTLGSTIDLSTKELLGQGRWGFVLRCQLKETNKPVAVKLAGLRGAAAAQREWQHTSALGKHKNIAGIEHALLHYDERFELKKFLEQACKVPGKAEREIWPTRYLCLVQDFANKGSLGNLLQQSVMPLEIAGIGSVVRQIATALAFVHSRKRVHNDIKPDNILLHDAGGQGVIVKLGDFGLADLSQEFSRDYELFGLTTLCTTTQEPFQKVDLKAVDEYAVRANRALKRLPVLGQPTHFAKLEDVQKKLPLAMAQIFRSEVDMKDVEQFEWLQGLELVLP
eukprot:gnl/MRDRNA2_/MRDRNA2_87653_c0_seq1.p1 gnl/MRDRNA2_/MRDRNA2_87653_c0~~gnl/MRDRNA2_/MRDRNA2_87653_c0_seq1.p1  ORF type:complete len:392 (+),score=71.44 gnl/MRDRNA2_/MRDRNA2_87653_c0_seq1:65-1240(+)